jgi:hypothetical protein
MYLKKFEFWLLISNFTLFKNLIFWFNQLHVINQMSFNVLSVCIKSMFWKLWYFFVHVVILKCTIHIQMHLCFTFSLNNYTFRFNDLLNNYVERWILIKILDPHIMIANCLKCPKFQHFVLYEKNNIFWCILHH